MLRSDMQRELFRVGDLRSISDVDRFIRYVRQVGSQTISIDLSETNTIFPNGATPFAAAVQYFRENGYIFKVEKGGNQFVNSSIITPTRATVPNLQRPEVSNIVWEYRASEAVKLSHAFIDALTEKVRCETGVIDSLLWALYEVLDNTFQHSHARSGFAMMQLHPKKNRCAIAVSDFGIGIHRSFVEGGSRYPLAIDAIRASVGERISSKPEKNRGNGLWGLLRIVQINGGRMRIRSGRGDFDYQDGDVMMRPVEPPLLNLESNHGTSVDWQVRTNFKVSMREAIGISLPADEWVEKYEDDAGEHRLLAVEFEDQIGARTSAEHLRNRIANMLVEDIPRIVIDFSGISMVSSSFADEVLGKLAKEMGPSEFRKKIRLDEMNKDVHAVISHAILGRTSEIPRKAPAS